MSKRIMPIKKGSVLCPYCKEKNTLTKKCEHRFFWGITKNIAEFFDPPREIEKKSISMNWKGIGIAGGKKPRSQWDGEFKSTDISKD